MMLLLGLRKFGNFLSMNDRVALPRSILRRVFRYAQGTLSIQDFDGNLAIKLDLSEHMQRRIFWMGYYNREIVALLNKTLRPGMVVIDAGANIGEISLIAAKRVGASGKVIAFEPIDKIADELELNINRNNLNQVTLVRSGLSDDTSNNVPIYPSSGQLRQKDKNLGLGSLFVGGTASTPIQHVSIITLDAWIDNHPLERLDLIKIDIEGAELHCLKGAVRTLRRLKPLIVIEVQNHSASAAGYKARDILDFLAPLGYVFHRIERQGQLSPLRAEDLTDYQNVLCTPMRT